MLGADADPDPKNAPAAMAREKSAASDGECSIRSCVRHCCVCHGGVQ